VTPVAVGGPGRPGRPGYSRARGPKSQVGGKIEFRLSSNRRAFC
jgi:hypothetical protein